MLKGVLVVAVIALAIVGLLAIVLVGYVTFTVVRFNRRNPHAREAANIRKRVEAQVVGGFYEDSMRIYNELRALVAAHPREPDLVRYLMEAAEPIARTAADRRDVATATELYRDAQEIMHVAAMHVLRELLRSFLPQDRGKALVCVERLARLAERYPEQIWIYWAAQRKFSGSV